MCDTVDQLVGSTLIGTVLQLVSSWTDMSRLTFVFKDALSCVIIGIRKLAKSFRCESRNGRML